MLRFNANLYYTNFNSDGITVLTYSKELHDASFVHLKSIKD